MALAAFCHNVHVRYASVLLKQLVVVIFEELSYVLAAPFVQRAITESIASKNRKTFFSSGSAKPFLSTLVRHLTRGRAIAGRPKQRSPSGRLGCGFKWACRNPSPARPMTSSGRGAPYFGEPAVRARISGTGRPIPRPPARQPTNHAWDGVRAACVHCRPSEAKRKPQCKKKKKIIKILACISRVKGLACLACLRDLPTS